MKKSSLIVVAAIILIIAVFLLYLVVFKGGKFGQGIRSKYGIGIDFGGIGKGTENVLENMPATNPLENVANPFRDTYKNPF